MTMISEADEFIPRPPRHESDPNIAGVVVATQSDRFAATLFNLSRQGLQVAVPSGPIDVGVGESVRIGIAHEASGFVFDRVGIVRWQNESDAAGWIVGVQFAEEVDWETLGEMFLSGLLAR